MKESVRIKSEAPLKLENIQFGIFAELCTDMLCVIQPDGYFKYINPALTSVLGYSVDEINTLSLFDLSHPDDDKVIRDVFIHSKNNDPIEDLQQRCRCLDGTYRNLEWKFSYQAVSAQFYGVAHVITTETVDNKIDKEALRNAIDSAVDAIYIIDEEARIIYINDYACTTLGYDHDELLNLSIFEISPNLTPEEFNDARRQSRMGDIRTNETVHQRKDGSTFPVEVRSSLKKLNGKEISCAIVRDITERKKDMRETEELRYAVENAVDAVYLSDITGNIYYVNQSACQALGYSYEELTSMTLKDVNPVLSLDDRTKFLDEVRRGGPQTIEAIHQRKDGSRFPVEITFNLKSFEDTEYACSFVRDISDRKQAAEDLLIYEQIVNASSDSMFFVDTNYIYRAVNQRFLEVFNKTREEVIGQSINKILGQDHFETISKPNIDKCLDGEQVITQSWYTNPISEKRRCVDIHYMPYRQSDGEITGVVISAHDVSEIKLAEKALQVYEHIVNASSDAMCFVDTDYVYKAANRNYLDSFRKSRDELIGYTISEVLGEEHFHTYSKPNLDRCFAGEPVNLQAWYEHPFKGDVFLDVNYIPYRKEDGKITGVVISTHDIKNLVLARKDLEQSEKRLREVQKLAKLGFWEWDIVNGELFWSDETYLIFGLEADKFKATLDNFLATVHPEDQAYVHECLDAAIKGERPYNLDHRIVLPDGTYKFVHAQGEISWGDNSQAVKMFGTVQDITERKIAERKTEELRFAVENAVDAVYLTEPSGKIFYANQSACESLGYSYEELTSMNTVEIDPNLTEEWRHRYHESMDTDIQQTIETIHRRKDGSTFPVELTFKFNPRGESGFSSAIVRDITERKEAARQKEELQFAIENSIDNVFIYTEDAKIHYVNNSACTLLGYSFDELTSMTLFDIALDLTEAIWSDRWRSDLKNRNKGQQLLLEGYHRRKDGSKYPVEISTHYAEFDGVTYGYSFVRDITERKRSQSELKKYQEHLQELVDSRTSELKDTQEKLVQKERLAVLGQLTGVVSHELRNPLGTIRSSVYLLRDKIKDKSGLIQRAIARAERNIVRCDQIIEELLDYARASQLETKSTLIDKWLAGVLDDYEFPQDVTVETKFNAGVKVLLEKERFRRCMINVLSNACEAMQEASEDGPNLLQIQTQTDNEKVEIRIIDNGPGIAEELQEKIFEPLYSTKGFGVGLGLPIVEQIMQQHGGKVTITSDRDKGTTVKLSLPVEKNTQQEVT